MGLRGLNEHFLDQQFIVFGDVWIADALLKGLLVWWCWGEVVRCVVAAFLSFAIVLFFMSYTWRILVVIYATSAVRRIVTMDLLRDESCLVTL